MLVRDLCFLPSVPSGVRAAMGVLGEPAMDSSVGVRAATGNMGGDKQYRAISRQY